MRRTAGFTIEPGDPEEPAVARLLDRSEEHAHSLYPPEGVHMLPVGELASPSVRFLVARHDATGDVLGLGALVLKPAYGEIKRMFVDPTARRQGVGAEILGALERVARAEGIGTLRLETGPSQPEAVALYRRFGYRERGPFGEYRDDPFCIFMEKSLDEGGEADAAGTP
jgi:choline dehydrogenase